MVRQIVMDLVRARVLVTRGDHINHQYINHQQGVHPPCGYIYHEHDTFRGKCWKMVHLSVQGLSPLTGILQSTPVPA